MRIISCLHPKRIINPYTHEKQVVACGKCAACLNSKSFSWVNRLNVETNCWKYCVFFTLTYNNENIPTLINYGDYFCDYDLKHIRKPMDMPVLHKSDFESKVDDKRAFELFWRTNYSIHYASKYDAQCFVKNIRIKLHRLHEKENSSENSQIRYYIVSEYGPEHRRPHFHGLFWFNSALTAKEIQCLISETWKFGFVNSSFPERSASSYVASYLMCTAHLPEIYSVCKFLRPFILCSKQPPIGTLAVKNETIQEIFHSCSPEMLVRNPSRGNYVYVPLLRYYKDKLFPRIRSFDKFNDRDRIALYGISKVIPQQNACSFVEYCRSHYDGLSSYLRAFIDDCDSQNPYSDYALVNLYYISCRVLTQCEVFGVSLKEYVEHIVRFYSNVELLKLHNQYELIEKKIKDEGFELSSFAGLDEDFLQGMFDCDSFADLTVTEMMFCDNYGIDINKFFHEDVTIRDPYRQSLMPHNQWFYQSYKLDQEIIRNLNVKTKRKNESLRYQFNSPVF